MKKQFYALLLIATLLLITLSGCKNYFGYEEINDKNLQSTDLSNVTIARLRLGSNTDDIDTSISRRKTDRGYILYGFVDTEEYEVELYNNDEVLIASEPDGTITRIDGRIHVGLEFEINGVDSPQNLQEIKNFLGNNYNDYLYSRELGYNATTYTDVENGISLTFFHNISDSKLVWAILTTP